MSGQDANVIVDFIVTTGSIPPRTLLTFLGTLTFVVALTVLLIRLSGIRKLSLKDGVEFEEDGITPKKLVSKPRRKRIPKK